MLRNRVVVLTSVALACFLGGCGKKDQPVINKKVPQIKQTAASQKASGQKEDDIFNEFYDEGKPGASKKNARDDSKETFSTKPFKSTKNSSASTTMSSVSFSENGTYVIQISCVKSRTFANNLVAQLKKKGYPAYVSEVVDPTPQLPGTYYRVRIGGFEGESIARGFAKNELSGAEFWVDKKSNDAVGLRSADMSGSYNASSYSEYVPAPSQPAAAPVEQSTMSTPEPIPAAVAPAPAPEPVATSAATPETTPTIAPAPAVAEPVAPVPAPAATTTNSAPQSNSSGTPAKSDWGNDDWGTPAK